MSWISGTNLMGAIIKRMRAQVTSAGERAAVYEGLVGLWEDRGCDSLVSLIGQDVAFDVALYRHHPGWWEGSIEEEVTHIDGPVPTLPGEDGGRELSYEEGRRAAGRDVIRIGLSLLGREAGDERRAARLELERDETRSALRRLCEHHGDNDWGDDLYLADVLDKHLARYLED